MGRHVKELDEWFDGKQKSPVFFKALDLSHTESDRFPFSFLFSCERIMFVGNA